MAEQPPVQSEPNRAAELDAQLYAESIENEARRLPARCDTCAAAWKHKDGDGKWCDSCFVGRLTATLAKAEAKVREYEKALQEFAGAPNIYGRVVADYAREVLTRSNGEEGT